MFYWYRRKPKPHSFKSKGVVEGVNGSGGVGKDFDFAPDLEKSVAPASGSPQRARPEGGTSAPVAATAADPTKLSSVVTLNTRTVAIGATAAAAVPALTALAANAAVGSQPTGNASDLQQDSTLAVSVFAFCASALVIA